MRPKQQKHNLRASGLALHLRLAMLCGLLSTQLDELGGAFALHRCRSSGPAAEAWAPEHSKSRPAAVLDVNIVKDPNNKRFSNRS